MTLAASSALLAASRDQEPSLAAGVGASLSLAVGFSKNDQAELAVSSLFLRLTTTETPNGLFHLTEKANKTKAFFFLSQGPN
jgi:hypothetical protein